MAAFFPSVMDFTGINNRYGQVAVPDFLDYLCSQSPNLSELIKITFSTRLQCLSCKWVSENSCSDVSLKLHIPSGKKYATLAELVDHNSSVMLTNNNTVFCGNCHIKTAHHLKRGYNPDLFL